MQTPIQICKIELFIVINMILFPMHSYSFERTLPWYTYVVCACIEWWLNECAWQQCQLVEEECRRCTDNYPSKACTLYGKWILMFVCMGMDIHGAGSKRSRFSLLNVWPQAFSLVAVLSSVVLHARGYYRKANGHGSSRSSIQPQKLKIR